MTDASVLENDDYEPPEATPPVDIPSPIESPPFSPAPPESIPDAEEDTYELPSRPMTDNNDTGKPQVNNVSLLLTEVLSIFIGRSCQIC